MLSNLNESALQGQLWQSVIETVDSQGTDPEWANCLRARVAIGVERMQSEGRLAPEDLAIAHANLRNFIRLIKIETVFLRQRGQSRYGI